MSTTHFFLATGPGWDRLHGGPLSSHVDDFADWLADQGYARSTGRRKLRKRPGTALLPSGEEDGAA